LEEACRQPAGGESFCLAYSTIATSVRQNYPVAETGDAVPNINFYLDGTPCGQYDEKNIGEN
jgi:hypothetical protein